MKRTETVSIEENEQYGEDIEMSHDSFVAIAENRMRLVFLSCILPKIILLNLLVQSCS